MYQIYGEKCCGQACPQGLDQNPYFSWRLQSDKNDLEQRSWRIYVKDKSGNLMWDSGYKEGKTTHNHPYEGIELKSATDYVWYVESNATDGSKAISEEKKFTTGILKDHFWRAKWIEADYQRKPCCDETDVSRIFEGGFGKCNSPEEKLNPCLYFRKETVLEKKVQSAKAYVTAHGIYEIYINEKCYGYPLAPGYTAYEDYLEYQCYDVTDAFTPGVNVIGAIVADGWYLGKVGLLGIGNQYGETSALLMQIHLLYEDGTSGIICTDKTFEAGTGAFLYADLYIGEGYDAGKKPTGWLLPGYRNPEWKQVKEKNYSYTQLRGASDEPAAFVKIIKAKQLLTSPKGEKILDVGENIAGFISIKGSAQKGDIIKLEHSEILDDKGNFLQNIMGQNKNQTDVYIVGEDGEFAYRPRFTFHGFQYVRISGIRDVSLEDIEVYVLASDLERTGTFLCSDPKLNKLQENIYRSQQGNMLYIPTDCPQREKSGFTGDMQVFLPTAAYLMDVEAFLRKWLKNMQCEQKADGQIPHTIPDIPSGAKVVSGVSSSGWADACVIIPYKLYMVYDDKTILQDNFDMMLKWMNYVEQQAAAEIPHDYKNLSEEEIAYHQYLWNTGFHFGDWLIPSLNKNWGTESSNASELTKEIVGSAMFAYTTELMTIICDILGEKKLAEYYEMLNKKIKTAFAKVYVKDNGRLKTDYQGMYVLALQMNLIPEGIKEKSVERLVQLIEENNGCLDTGFLSMPFLLDVLYENGREEEAFKILFQEKCPSWLYEVNMGANTIWESWNNILENGTRRSGSYNHFAFGCVGDFMYRRILGIQSMEPGYRRVKIKPGFMYGLSSAKGSFESIFGCIAVTWKKTNDKLLLDVELPPGVEGEVEVGSFKRFIKSGKYRFEKSMEGNDVFSR